MRRSYVDKVALLGCSTRDTDLRNKAAGPYTFIGLGAIDIAKPYKCLCFGDIDGPKACDFIGSGGFYFANTGISAITETYTDYKSPIGRDVRLPLSYNQARRPLDV